MTTTARMPLLDQAAGPRSRGFTLLELLVAMFIAAVIFAMGYGAINQAAKSRVELQEQQAKLLELQNTVRTMEQDFLQLAPRPIRDPVGGTYQPALLANNSGSGANISTSSNSSNPTQGGTTAMAATQALVSLTRMGWTNPAGLQRPALQRVAYYFQDGTLRREYWPVLDPTQASTAIRHDLMKHLKSVSLRFLDVGSVQSQSQSQSQGGQTLNGNWSPIWPPVNHAGQNNQRYRPIAVEITLETEDWGKIVRLVEVAG
jgi:general secretion pathway protein J